MGGALTLKNLVRILHIEQSTCYRGFPISMKHSGVTRFQHIWENNSTLKCLYTTGSQNGWGWKGPLEVIWSYPPCSSRDHCASSSGPCSGITCIAKPNVKTRKNLIYISITKTIWYPKWKLSFGATRKK